MGAGKRNCSSGAQDNIVKKLEDEIKFLRDENKNKNLKISHGSFTK